MSSKSCDYQRMPANFSNELERCLTGDSFAASPANILEDIPDALAHREFPGAPRTVYAELWHIVFWQQISLDWVSGRPTPNPDSASGGFPTFEQTAAEPWPALCERFTRTSRAIAEFARAPTCFEQVVECPSPPGHPTRFMTVREQLESLLGHNAYHFGRIVLLRQIAGAWPPMSGNFTL